jgi:diguanylate cyclase
VALNVHRADEIGQLAASLDHMRAGIAERERRILTLSYQNPLTGLGNRSKFAEDLALAIGRAQGRAEIVSILVMDLDRFKYVNDTLGHDVGDHLLAEVAVCLEHIVPAGASIARLGGDEFAILLHWAPEHSVLATSEAIISALETPIYYDDQPLDVRTSIGIAHYPDHGQDAQALMRNADIAMCVAKRTGNCFAVYNQRYDTTQQEHLSLLGELRQFSWYRLNTRPLSLREIQADGKCAGISSVTRTHPIVLPPSLPTKLTDVREQPALLEVKRLRASTIY